MAKPLTRMEGRHVPGEPRGISNRQQNLLFKSLGERYKLGIMYHQLTWQQSQSKKCFKTSYQYFSFYITKSVNLELLNLGFSSWKKKSAKLSPEFQSLKIHYKKRHQGKISKMYQIYVGISFSVVLIVSFLFQFVITVKML